MDITSYLLGKQAGGGSANLQAKTVEITENGTQNISADAGYDGLSNVGITTNVQPDLESKSITINSNTTTTITPTSGKDGLSSVEVTTNVQPSSFQYIQDGLVAWFDETEPIGNDLVWHNKLGSDYIYMKYTLSNPGPTRQYYKPSGECLRNDAVYTFATSYDYYKEGYTIEIVASSFGYNYRSQGGWLVTGNINGTSGIGIKQVYSGSNLRKYGYVSFMNTSYDNEFNQNFEVNIGETFGTSVCFKTLKSRDYTEAYAPTIKASVNGSSYMTSTATNAEARTSRGDELLFLSSYNADYMTAGSIRCIRIYNRELTQEEMLYNYNIDVNRFNIGTN